MRKAKFYFDNEQSVRPVNFGLKHLVRKTVRAVLAYEQFTDPVEISVTFTDNEGIRELNREHRSIDRATDVLSFPMYDFHAGEVPPEDERVALGDIVLSLERAAEQATEFGHSYEREVGFLTAHSVLHLLGYDHERSPEEDEDMRRRQREILDGMGLTR